MHAFIRSFSCWRPVVCAFLVDENANEIGFSRRRRRWLFIHWMHKSDTIQLTVECRKKKINQSHRMHSTWKTLSLTKKLLSYFFVVSVHCVTIAISLWKFLSPVVSMQCSVFSVVVYFVHVSAAKRRNPRIDIFLYTKYAAPKTTFTWFSRDNLQKHINGN